MCKVCASVVDGMGLVYHFELFDDCGVIDITLVA